MEYIQSRFMQLADSLLAPVWAWVMARSWMFRLSVFVLGGVIVVAWDQPGIVSENYRLGRLGVSTLKIAMADGGLALDSDTKANLSSATQRMEKTFKDDLSSFSVRVQKSLALAYVEGEKRCQTATPSIA